MPARDVLTDPLTAWLSEIFLELLTEQNKICGYKVHFYFTFSYRRENRGQTIAWDEFLVSSLKMDKVLRCMFKCILLYSLLGFRRRVSF